MAVLGFDNQLIAELTTPAITTVHQPTEELGKQTINLMFNILENKSYKIEDEKLNMHIVIRESA